MKSGDNPYCQCLYYSANALARSLTRMAEDAFSKIGLAPTQAFLLMSANKNPGIQPSELASILMLMPSTVTRTIERLEDKGLVERKFEGKTSHIFPTSSGLSLDGQLNEVWSDLYRRYVHVLGEEKSKTLTAMSYAATLALER